MDSIKLNVDVVIYGPPGSGKSTLSNLLREVFEKRGITYTISIMVHPTEFITSAYNGKESIHHRYLTQTILDEFFGGTKPEIRIVEEIKWSVPS